MIPSSPNNYQMKDLLHSTTMKEEIRNVNSNDEPTTDNILGMYSSPVWKIQKMVKNPCLSVKNMRIGCEKFQKKFGLNWRFP